MHLDKLCASIEKRFNFMVHFGNSWDEVLKGEFDKEYYLKLREFLKFEYSHYVIYPKMENIFNALKTTSYEDVKVCILGQDPYHGPGQAQGYSFSVPSNFPLPPSLQNMYKELENEYQTPVHRTGDLTDWAKQGVLLMNTILTVEEHKPLSHQDMGWQNFTNEALRWINEKDGPVVFLLWGAKAIQAKKLLTNPKHLILTSPHPSPLSAYRGFFGNNHFKLANEYLVKNNETPIQWI